ncbi:unnamed protein product [Pylaiella littoralis]
MKSFGMVAVTLCCAAQASAGALHGIRSALMTQHQQQHHSSGSVFGMSHGGSRRGWNVERACSPVQGRRMAAALPGDSFTGEVVVGGLLNFLSIYNILITGRVLLSWVPQLQGVQALQPVYLLTDPYLNAFRRLNLTIGGLDLSVLPAFFLLSFATNAVASLGAEIPAPLKRGAGWLNGRRAAVSGSRRNLAAMMSGNSSPSSNAAEGSSSAAAAAAPSMTTKSRRPLFAFRV